ncbi:MAG: SpoIID/LytB domain-containing protein [Firmicutes bacterium]|nr:SpoIID/LytB domain-containing protein [Bacillota bacterium]NLO65130.1 SpoIID/LytB domain-containing protein [Bacillota bacterium]
MRKKVMGLALALALLCLVYSSPVGAAAAGCPTPLALPGDKVMRISRDFVEFEHHGQLPIAAEVQCFHHWEDQVWEVPLAAVLVGFEDVVATVFNGEIIRFDVYDPLYIRTVRVAITTDNFAAVEHKELRLEPTSRLYVEETGTGRGFVAVAGQEVVVSVQAGRLVLIDGEGNPWEFDRRLYLWADEGGMVQINSFQRGTTNRFFPRYRGRFELTVVDEDSFLAINEVDLEEYLYQVVPSEMVISWPMEALKAQAVASRTYAVAQVIYSRQGHLGFHVSDSTNSQVYNNQPEAASATRAIQETAEQILAKEDDTIGSTYFYSTSPRRVMDSKQAWNDLSELYLEGKSPWYRWQCYFSAEELAELFRSNTDIPPGEVLAVEVGERDELGRVVVLTVKTSGGTGTIVGELNIRRALKPKRLQRINDTVTGLSLLPSAMFFVESKRDGAGKLLGVTLFGGGSGHGLGMAQWGAKGMAEAGSDYLTILRTYYPEMQLFTHSDQLRY